MILPQLLLTHQEVHLQAKLLARHRAVHKPQVLGNGLVEDQAAHGGVVEAVLHLPVHFLAIPDPNGGMQAHISIAVRHNGLLHAGVAVLGQEGSLLLARFLGGLVGSQERIGVHQLALGQVSVSGVCHIDFLCPPLRLAQADIGEVVGAQNHILGGHRNRLGRPGDGAGCWPRA